MVKNEKRRIAIDAKKIAQTNLEIEKAHFNDIEVEKKVIQEELERGKRYLIEEVLYEGEELLAEIDQRERKKKSVWNRIMDFIFK